MYIARGTVTGYNGSFRQVWSQPFDAAVPAIYPPVDPKPSLVMSATGWIIREALKDHNSFHPPKLVGDSLEIFELVPVEL